MDSTDEEATKKFSKKSPAFNNSRGLGPIHKRAHAVSPRGAAQALYQCSAPVEKE